MGGQCAEKGNSGVSEGVVRVNIVSFGGGTNSTAMLIGMVERSIPVHAILFADTGGEKPHTYLHVEIVNRWLAARELPLIVTPSGPRKTLEQDCLDRKALPSVAYGFKTCSQRWKAEPQQKWRNQQGITDYVQFIGYDADEPHRAKPFPGNRYPLIEWGWGREDCVEAIARAGLPQPGKSACSFCPSSKKHEIIELGRQYPVLLTRALAMEANADLGAIKGLGRRFAWRDVIAADAAQFKLLPDTLVAVDCGCYDGE